MSFPCILPGSCIEIEKNTEKNKKEQEKNIFLY
jgi:hypothetical protein